MLGLVAGLPDAGRCSVSLDELHGGQDARASGDPARGAQQPRSPPLLLGKDQDVRLPVGGGLWLLRKSSQTILDPAEPIGSAAVVPGHVTRGPAEVVVERS